MRALNCYKEVPAWTPVPFDISMRLALADFSKGIQEQVSMHSLA